MLPLLLGLLLPALPAAAQSPPVAQHDLLAAGPVSDDSQWLYLARTTSKPGAGENDPPIVQTQIYRRSMAKPFVLFGKPLNRRIVAMAPRDGQVAILGENGGWVLQSEAGVVMGLPLSLPEARLIDLASDRDSLYAIAKVPGGRARLAESAVTSEGAATDIAPQQRTPTTAPATAPATGPATTAAGSTTRPATQMRPATDAATRPQYNAPDTLVLVQYAGGGWQPIDDIPFEVARPLDSVSLAIIDGVPFLLVREAPEQLRLWRLDGVKWSQVGQATIAASTRVARMVSGGRKPTVWLSPAVESPGEPDHVLVFDAAGLGVTRTIPRGSPTTAAAEIPSTAPATTAPAGAAISASGLANEMTLAVTAGIPPNLRSAAFAFNYFRSISFVGDEVVEQAYDPVSFAAVESPRKQTLAPPGLDYFDVVQYGLVAAAMAFAIMASLRRRSELMSLEIDPAALPLAPLGTRLLAGIIDATPLIAALFYNAFHYGAEVEGQQRMEADIVLTVGFAAYFFITLFTEMLAGRSFGKMICGLRVITVTGQPVTKGQLATRNILRIIDVVLQAFPLLLIPFSPLRQRAGDAAAGTIVVTIHPQKPAEEEPEE